jgi:hypothetical protein
MGTIMIRCPNTGRAISTGIETDPVTFVHLPDLLSQSKCSLCGAEHVWWTREAWLDGDMAPPVRGRQRYGKGIAFR